MNANDLCSLTMDTLPSLLATLRPKRYHGRERIEFTLAYADEYKWLSQPQLMNWNPKFVRRDVYT